MTEITENVNVENAEIPEESAMTETQNAENVNVSDNAETQESPKWVLPNRDEIDFGETLPTELAKQMVTEIQSIKDIDGILDRQKSDFNEDKLVSYGSESDDPEIKRISDQFNKQVERMEKLKAELIAKVSEKLGESKLSEEEIAAKKEQRKTLADAVRNSSKVLASLLEMGTFANLSEENVSAIKEFAENATVPGSRSVSAGSSGSASTAAPKPRLNGGSVTVGDQNHNNFPLAAAHISKLVNREVPPVELINAWVESQNVGNWKDTPEISDFTFDGIGIHVWKKPKEKK